MPATVRSGTRRPAKRKSIDDIERSIKRKLAVHLRATSHPDLGDVSLQKEGIRIRHSLQRRERLIAARDFLQGSAHDLLKHFASGVDVVPERIAPHLEVVTAGTRSAEIFRLASLTWSIPVSEGYGRRIRFLVWDQSNEKLIGLIALGDPVFNLGVRDNLIGWSAAERKERLVNVMDAYVLGAVPPYNALLGGKMVACLVRSAEIRNAFDKKYGKTTGIISQQKKHAKLVMVTTSSALGRSAVYNRLKLEGMPYFSGIGYTEGFGHFHVPPSLFGEMRDYLRRKRSGYSDENRFGSGPNWRFRAIREAIEMMGLNRDLLRHGIKREVFACNLASNAHKILRGEHVRPNYRGLLSAEEIGVLARERWICPRASTRPEFAAWRRESLLELLSTKK